MKATISREYTKQRDAGYNAVQAFRNARIVECWNEALAKSSMKRRQAMNAKHTPEPWIADDYYDMGAGLEIRNNGMRVARMLTLNYESHGTREANAARIVACVNALEGVTNEEIAALPKGELARLIRAGKAARLHLTKAVDLWDASKRETELVSMKYRPSLAELEVRLALALLSPR